MYSITPGKHKEVVHIHTSASWPSQTQLLSFWPAVGFARRLQPSPAGGPQHPPACTHASEISEQIYQSQALYCRQQKAGLSELQVIQNQFHFLCVVQMYTHFSSAFMLGALILWSVDWSRVTWAFRSWAIFFTSAASSTWTARDTTINDEIQLPWWISQTWHIYYQKQYVENIPHWEVMKASRYSLLVRMSHMIYSHVPSYKYTFLPPTHN